MRFFDVADLDKDERRSMSEVIAHDAAAIRRGNAAMAATAKRK